MFKFIYSGTMQSGMSEKKKTWFDSIWKVCRTQWCHYEWKNCLPQQAEKWQPLMKMCTLYTKPYKSEILQEMSVVNRLLFRQRNNDRSKKKKNKWVIHSLRLFMFNFCCVIICVTLLLHAYYRKNNIIQYNVKGSWCWMAYEREWERSRSYKGWKAIEKVNRCICYEK